MLIKKQAAMTEQISPERRHTVNLLKALYDTYDEYPLLQGLLIRFSKSPGYRHIFDEEGGFKRGLVTKQNFKEALIKYLKEFIAERERTDGKSSVDEGWYELENAINEDTDIMLFVFESITADPHAISDLGMAVYDLKVNIEEQVSHLSEDPIEQQAIIDYVQNWLVPEDMRFRGKGKLNKVFSFSIESINKTFMIALRMPLEKAKEKMTPEEKQRVVWVNSYSSQIEIHERLYDMMNEAQENNPEKVYARVPEPYYTDTAQKFMLMEFVEKSFQLTDIIKKVPDREKLEQVLLEIQQRLENTLELWEQRQDGENGPVTFRHYDLHSGNILVTLNEDKTLKDIHIIDFDFSAFEPYEVSEYRRPPRVLSSSDEPVRFITDRQSLGFIKEILKKLRKN